MAIGRSECDFIVVLQLASIHIYEREGFPFSGYCSVRDHCTTTTAEGGQEIA